MQSNRNPSPFKWIKLSVLLFIVSAVTGLFGSLFLAFSSWNGAALPFQVYRPLHTFLALMAVLAGAIGLLHFFRIHPMQKSPSISNGQDNGLNTGKIHSFPTFGFFILFLSAGILLIAAGNFTGREYLPWHPALTLILLLVLGREAYILVTLNKRLVVRSPEGFWLSALGLIFVISGVLESQLWRVPFVGYDIVRDLTVQWHGIDTFIAGMNALMYGCGIFIIQKKPKPLRKSWLYGIAVFSLLFTFGHHHYISPQPHYLKIFAFLASMIAMVSFFRHLGTFRKNPLVKKKSNGRSSLRNTLIRSIEFWTLISILSGVLFAIPQVNLVVHGTYLIVIHAMGSMIGVNLLFIYLGGIHFGRKLSPDQSQKMRHSIKGINYSLALLWIVLGGAGLVKGIMRFDTSYWTFMDSVEPFLYFFPVAGLGLTISIIMGGWILLMSKGGNNMGLEPAGDMSDLTEPYIEKSLQNN